jgi:hypothetical protein
VLPSPCLLKRVPCVSGNLSRACKTRFI